MLICERATIVNTIVGYPKEMRFFSTAERLAIGGIPFPSVEFRPTRRDALAYYRGVVESENLPIALGCEVIGACPCDDGFLVETSQGTIRTRCIVVATGYFDQTNLLEAEGQESAEVHYYYDEAYRYFGRHALVIGGRNSAVETALDLYRNGVDVTMIHRGSSFGSGLKYWIRPDIENRIASGEIAMMFDTEVVLFDGRRVELINRETGAKSQRMIDVTFAMIGYRPDVVVLESLSISYDTDTLVPVFDSMTFETEVPGLYLAGSVACGARTWEIFIENGREHAAIVAAEVAGRH